ncbi:hypothetical protein QTJ16_002955 [Diplocarpon rosae]|uniref:Zygote-specific protein n=1 Tax=Diplocarpon rosae TaxID=946125 RepID=A0AAD9WGL8_9HELO|nr:hypothetical protein QTJ16_002955 [Diplocarpon rosae]PBP22829.1 hypothetical protein BUE80_DR006293 [Diplocarpon rosae]
MLLPAILVLFAAPAVVFSGPIAYGTCQGGCAAVVMACYTAAGATWGATLGLNAPATVLGCNSAFGYCQAKCAVVALLPTF